MAHGIPSEISGRKKVDQRQLFQPQFPSDWSTAALASVRTITSEVPALMSCLEHSLAVAPVVITSSTSITRLPLNCLVATNAPLRFFVRYLAERPIWGRVSTFLNSPSRTRGMFFLSEMVFARRRDWLNPRLLSPLMLRGTGKTADVPTAYGAVLSHGI